MTAPVIETRLNPDDPQARARAAHNRALAEDLRQRAARVAEGGDARSRERHVARGKLLPRERVENLLDVNFYRSRTFYDPDRSSPDPIAHEFRRRQEHITLNRQVLPETGVILPGQFVRYVGPETVTGIVRSTSINWTAPKLRQTLEVETHA